VEVGYRWRAGACGSAAPGTPNIKEGAASAMPDTVRAGASVTGMRGLVGTPSKPGVYCLQIDIVQSGVAWFADLGSQAPQATVTVQ
jgi:hypothetical protein